MNFISSDSKIVNAFDVVSMTISRTIGLVLAPFTALYRSFLKLFTLTNKTVGTIWRALSKSPQRRQGPDPRPLWLLVGTPSALIPLLAYRLRVAQPTLMDISIYFWYILLYYYICLCTTFLWLLRFGLLLVLRLYKEDYLHIFKCVSFWLHGCCGWWNGSALVNRFNHTSGVDDATPTDRPKSVGNRCVIEVFDGVFFFVVALLFGFFWGWRGFCHRTESDLFLFLLEPISKYFVAFLLCLSY